MVLAGFVLLCGTENRSAAGDRSVTVYGARLSNDDLGNALEFRAKYGHSWLLALALSQRVYSYKKYYDLEIEGQAVKHFGYQTHWEFNALPAVRWNPFPWDKYLETSLAIGAGLSYALEEPRLESDGVESTPKLLAFLMYEIAVALPSLPQLSIVMRLHHRSGAFGAFGGRYDASNGIGYGIKYSF